MHFRGFVLPAGCFKGSLSPWFLVFALAITEILLMLPVQSSLPQSNVLQFRQSALTGIGRAPGTFGELLQGSLAGDSNNFLVTFPISREAIATFQPNATSRDITTFPPQKLKASKLTRKLLDHYEIDAGGTLVFLEQLPEGKGLASSSADMVASARAVANYYRLDVDDALLATLLGSIEPTDGVMYDQCVSFFHRRCQLIERLGTLPPLVVVGIDEGSVVDTLEYNANASAHSDAETAEYAHLLEEISRAIRENDRHTLGKVSTRSAQMNQRFNPKQFLETAVDISEECDALGVVAAHSGTYLGILLDPMRSDFISQFSQVQTALSRYSNRPIEIFRSF